MPLALYVMLHRVVVFITPVTISDSESCRHLALAVSAKVCGCTPAMSWAQLVLPYQYRSTDLWDLGHIAVLVISPI